MATEYTSLKTLPTNWRTGKVEELFKFSCKPRDLKIPPDERIPFITEHVKGWEARIYSEISSGSFVFKGDLVVAKITPSFENGKQAILNGLPGDFAYATTEVWALHPKNDEASTEHLFHF